MRQNAQMGRTFLCSYLQGGLEMVMSEETGRYYATAKQASRSQATFNEATCRGLVGNKTPRQDREGSRCDPYEYTIKETGEVITLSTDGLIILTKLLWTRWSMTKA